MQQLWFNLSNALLYMFRVTISPIIRSTFVVYGHSGRHDAEQHDSEYLQLHTPDTDRTNLLRTYLLTKCACLPVVIYSKCTPDNRWDCHPKPVE